VDNSPSPDPGDLPAPGGLVGGLPEALPRPPRTVAPPQVSPGPLAWVGWGFTGAVVAALLWCLAKYAYQVNGFGVVDRLGWPFSDVYLCVAAGGVLGAIAGIVAHLRALRHAGEVADASALMGLSYTPVVSQEQMGAHRSLALFVRWSAARHWMRGRVEGVPVEVIDYTWINKGGSETDTYHHQTVVLLPAAEGMPRFELRPRTIEVMLLECLRAGGDSLDAEEAAGAERETVERFNELYFLSEGVDRLLSRLGKGEEDESARAAIRRLFTPELLAFFAARPGWCVESDGRHLAVWHPDRIVCGDGRAALVAEALSVRRAMAGDSPRGPADGAPVAPDRTHVTARLGGTALGAFAGCFAGFFVGGIAGLVTLFLRDPFAPGAVSLTLLIFLGGTFGGLVLGALLGNRLLSHTFRAVRRRRARK